MHIVIFDKWAVERIKWSSLLACGEGLKVKGIDFTFFNPQYFNIREAPEADLIFTWGFNNFQIQEYYQGKADIVLVDRGFFRRDLDYRYIVKNNRLPQEKSNDRYQALGIQRMNGRRPNESHVLICLQNHHKQWYNQSIDMIKANVSSDREVRIRPFNSLIPLEKDLRGALAVISFNSTCLYMAIAQGIPVFCDPSCLAAIEGVAEIDLTTIESAKVVDSTQFLNNLAYAQWTLSEIKNGDFIEHILGESINGN